MEYVMCTKMPIVLIFALVSILNNVHGMVENSELVKAPKLTQRIDISYILNPLTPTVIVMCRANIKELYLKIICPAFKNVRADEKNFDRSIVDDKCKRLKNDSWYRCSEVIRTISWKGIPVPTKLNCSCFAREEGLENYIYKASVEIINYEQKVNKNTVLRMNVNEKKNICLHCYITGYPTPEITWYRDSIVLNKSGSAIKNLRYQQKNDRLVINRTDVRDSGSYQCFARNTAGEAGGVIYRVEVFESRKNISDAQELQNGFVEGNTTESRTNISDGSELQNGITKGDVTGKKLALESNETVHNRGAKFVKTNETVDNKEEEQNKKRNGRSFQNVLSIALVVCGITFIIILVGILLFTKRKKRLSEENTVSTTAAGSGRSTKSNCKVTVALPEPPEQFHVEEDEDTLSKLYSRKCQHKESIPEIHIQSFDYPSKSDVLNNDIECVMGSTSNEICTLDQVSEELLTKTSEQLSTLPLFKSPSYFTQGFEDLEVFPADQCSSSPILPLSTTDLNVDTTDNDNRLAPTIHLGRSTRESFISSTNSEISALIDKLITIPPNADQRYFTSALIDHNGGEVILEETGIKLIIPEGALDVGKTEAAYLALAGNPEYIPHDINADESLLSPVVLCGPHGLCFKKHVLLILPHCVAVTDGMEQKFRVLCSNTAPEIVPEWKEIFNHKEKPNEEVFCYMGEQNFCLFVKHFTWYAIPGEGKVRNFSVRAYHTSFHQRNEEFKVRVHLIPSLPKSNKCQKKVDELETKLQGRLCDAPKTKIFHKKGGDVKVEAYEISEGWRLIGGNIQTEGYDELRYCNEESANLTFHFEHETPRPEGISLNLKIYQEKCAFDIPVNIRVSLNFEGEIKRDQYQNKNDENQSKYTSVTSFSSGYGGSGESTPTRFIPRTLRKDLIELLDKEVPAVSDWKTLADDLDQPLQFIQWLQYSRHIDSPTEKVLMQWENDTEENALEALCSLAKILEKIKRVDAASKIQKYLETLLDGKETTV